LTWRAYDLTGVRRRADHPNHAVAYKPSLTRSAVTNLKENEEVPEIMACTHLDQIQEVTPSANGCEECLKIGDTWVHLRLCMTCGHVGCCDSSKNRHATKHFQATQHPIIKSFQPGEDWGWCYVDEEMLDEL
jgi:uncharacterized UBP type Zn finger protein